MPQGPGCRLGFADMDGLELMLTVFIDALESYHSDRVPHHILHGHEADLRLMPLVISVDEMEAFLEHFAEEGVETPTLLCPILSDINQALQHHTMVAPRREYGDPRNN